MSDFSRQFAYDAWANQYALDAIEQALEAPQRALQIMAHIVAAQDLWLERLLDGPRRVEVWPAHSAADCGRYLHEVQSRWRSFLDGLDESEMQRGVTYTNSLGERWSNTVGDILQHVLFHGAYHRGQIATHMRNGGCEPAYTDFIHAVRQGFVE